MAKSDSRTRDTVPPPVLDDVDPLHEGPQRLYAAYCADAGGVNERGERAATWNDLSEATRQHWRAAYLAVA